VNGRRLWWVLAVLVAAALLVAVGRWERERRADEETRGMQAVLADVGPLDSPSLSAFRVLSDFQCLAYRRGGRRLALEVCFDSAGRVVEAIDRRSGDPEIWSLRDDPTSSTVRRDRGEVEALLIKMGVPRAIVLALRERAGT
jgi:hypothetical protein